MGVHHIFKIKRDDFTRESRELDVQIDTKLFFSLRHFLSSDKFVEIDFCCVLWIHIAIKLFKNEIANDEDCKDGYHSSYICRLGKIFRHFFENIKVANLFAKAHLVVIMW